MERKAIIIIAALFVLGSAQFAEAKGKITFFAKSQVESARVSVDDIARLEGFGDKALKTALRQVDLGTAPRPMGTRTLSRPLIESALKQAGLPKNVRLVFPKRIAIERPGQEIAAATLTRRAQSAVEAMAKDRWGEGHTISLSPLKIRSALVVPKGDWSLEILTRTDAPPLGATLVTVQVVIDGQTVATRPTSIKIAVEGPVCHAARAVKRGEVLGPGDVTEARGALTKGLLGCEAAIGQEAKGSLRTDSPLRASQLQPPRLVKRGDQVTIVFKSGGLQISAEGEAMKDGARGEWIPVSNLGSKRVIRAQVLALGQVQIQ